MTDTYRATQGRGWLDLRRQRTEWRYTRAERDGGGSRGNSQQSASLAVTVGSTVTVTADSQRQRCERDATAAAVTPPESETVNAESAAWQYGTSRRREESVVEGRRL